MYFEELRGLLLERIRLRVHNGELTERGLARLAGLSQPHMHNVLKGTRLLSTEMADRLLYHLRVSVLDLIDPGTLERHLRSDHCDSADYSYLPVLLGRLGPSVPWPTDTEDRKRFPVPNRATSRMWHPVVARLADDSRMYPLFAENDLVLLDQSHRARTQIDPNALYVLKKAGTGMIRRLRLTGSTLKVFSEHSQEALEQIAVDALSIPHYVRARAILIAGEKEWSGGAAADQDFLAA